jgi:hypothetical protein
VNVSDDGSLLHNLNRLHTTPMGAQRIQRNLGLDGKDPVAWCAAAIADSGAVSVRRGKNWYVIVDNCEITVNAYSYTIITAHPYKGTQRSADSGERRA